MKFLEDLAARRRFGMKPGLEGMTALCAALGNPEHRLRIVHVAGTNGKGAVTAILDAALRAAGRRVGRYTSPHLVRLNERFFLDGTPMSDAALEFAATEVAAAAATLACDITFFEALTATAFVAYARQAVDELVLETGLGGRLDATNVCTSRLSVITRIGLDHCDWLGRTLPEIAAEKAGIIKSGVPVVVGRNEPEAVEVIARTARQKSAPFLYAPDLVREEEIPADFSLAGGFNRENAVTAMAALKVLLGAGETFARAKAAFGSVVWPGRFQRVGAVIVDGAHNPPAATALAASLGAYGPLNLVAGFCGDKDVETVLGTLAPHIRRGFAVRTNNPRSLTADETAVRMRRAGIAAEPCADLKTALAKATDGACDGEVRALVCGSLFLAGEALVALGAYPWPSDRFDPAETLRA